MLAHADETIALNSTMTSMTQFTIVSPDRLALELERMRAAGVAFDREEAQLGLICVAAPLLRNGQVVGAVSVSGASDRFQPTRQEGVVRRAAEAIGRML